MSPKSKAITDTLYLQRLGQRWYARVPVPNKLRGVLGPYIRKALDTSDLNEARKRHWDFLPIAKGLIEAAQRRQEQGRVEPKARECAADRSYAAFRARLAKAGPALVTDSSGEEMSNPALQTEPPLVCRKAGCLSPTRPS
jgi:hypothetical protein